MIFNGKLIPPSLNYLVDAYLIEYPKNKANTLYVIFDGANDYLNSNVDDLNTLTAPEIVVASICHNARKLADHSLKNSARINHIALINLPDISLAPWYNKAPYIQEKKLAHDLIEKHNQLLESCQQELSADTQYQNRVHLLMIDAERAMREVLSSLPDSFNHSDACFTGGPFRQQKAHSIELPQPLLQIVENQSGSTCQQPDQYVFWDDVHPTRIIHAKIFNRLCGSLALSFHMSFHMSCHIPEDIADSSQWPKTHLNE